MATCIHEKESMTHVRLRGAPAMHAPARVLGIMAWVLAWVLPGAAQSARADSLQEVSEFGANPGKLLMYKHVPARLRARAPLVVVLHGCTQTASQFVAESGWDKLAGEHAFALVVPEQAPGNHAHRCFNWFVPDHQRRDQGEPRSIISMIEHMIATHRIDRKRVYIAGLSAGGAMTAVMLATYPDVFAGGAIMAGVPYACASDTRSAYGCMRGVDKGPAAWGDLVRAATSHQGAWPRVSIWHGTADSVVDDANLQELVDQWTDLHAVDRKSDETRAMGKATHDVYRDASGAVKVETWSIADMGHAIAVDPEGPEGPGGPAGPGGASARCGTAATYASDQDLCSSDQVARFFGLFGSARSKAPARKKRARRAPGK